MKKKEILDKSFTLIDKNGLEDFSMRKLAVELGCKPATIYHYYQNKSEILSDLYLSLHDKFFNIDETRSNTLEDYLFEQCKIIQENKKEFIFLIKYKCAGFMSEDTIKKIKDPTSNGHKKIKELFKGALYSNINFLLVKGPLTELAFSESISLSDEQLRVLVKKICLAIGEEN